MKNNHVSVLLNETIHYWQNQKTGVFFDCTFGRGGHSRNLLKILDSNSQLFAFDIDQEAIDEGQKLSLEDSRFKIIKTNFVELFNVWSKLKIALIDGILFDFGVSTPQLLEEKRGFSFHNDGPLDMRMDLDQKIDAKFIVNNYEVDKLVKIFKNYGEAKNASLVARKICEQRIQKPFETTLELVECIKNAVPTRMLYQNKHPARVYFQALRIEVNKELFVIENVLNQLEKVLNKNAIACFITFHSLEEKIVKKWINKNTSQINLPGVPEIILNKFSLLTKKPISPSQLELENNNKARSSKLWVVRKN